MSDPSDHFVITITLPATQPQAHLRGTAEDLRAALLAALAQIPGDLVIEVPRKVVSDLKELNQRTDWCWSDALTSWIDALPEVGS